MVSCLLLLLQLATLPSQCGVRNAECGIPHSEFPIPNWGDDFVLDTIGVYLPPGFAQGVPAVAAGSANCLAAWEDQRNGNRICAARVNHSGACLDPQGIAVSSAPSMQRVPRVAFNGTDYLIAWHDYRGGADPDIYAARMDETGRLLDSTGIAVSNAAGAQRYVTVASDGWGWLVAWQDWRNGESCDIYAARVDRRGNVLDPGGILISTAPGIQAYPAVTFGGSNYLVVWQDRTPGSYYDIYGARVTPSSTVLDPNGFAISSAGNSQRHPAAAFDGVSYFVVWQDRRTGDSSDVYGARVSQDAAVVDPEGIAISSAPNTQEEPSLAFDGNDYLVVWQDRRTWDSADVYGARVDRNGAVLDPNGIAISTNLNTQDCVGVAFDGQDYLCSWEDRRDSAMFRVYTTQVNPAGTVINPAGSPLLSMPNNQLLPAGAASGADYLVVWQDQRRTPEIRGIRLDATGVILDSVPLPISGGTAVQEAPAVATNAGVFFAVWQDQRNGDYDIYGARIAPDGTFLDPNGIPICTASRDQRMPRVAADGTNWFVVWSDARCGTNFGIYGARVDAGGIVLDPGGIPISTGVWDHRSPVIGFNGQDYLAVWQDWRSARFYNIYGTRITPAGTVLDTAGIVIAAGKFYQEAPALASSGDRWLIVWEDQRGTMGDIYGTRMTADGTVLDTTGIPIATRDADERAPAVVATGDSWLVGWESADDLLGRHVGRDGATTDTFSLAAQPDEQASPCLVAGTAGNVLLAYSGWAGYVQGRAYNAMRIWGKFPFLTGIAEPDRPDDARGRVLQCHPNPFRDRVSLQLMANGLRSGIRIYDVAGKLVQHLPVPAAGSVTWDGTDRSGHRLPAGIYLCRLDGDHPAAGPRQLILTGR